MQNENTKRVWLYARFPGNDGETLRCIRECAAKAQQDNCKIVGTSADERYGWLLRPGYREMMRQVKAGEMVSLGTMPMASTMTRRRLFPWRQYITSRTGRVRSFCPLSATMCPLQNSAEHWQRMVWM